LFDQAARQQISCLTQMMIMLKNTSAILVLSNFNFNSNLKVNTNSCQMIKLKKQKIREWNEKNKDKLYWSRLTREIYNPNNGHDYNDLTRMNNLSFFFVPAFSLS